MSSYQRRLTEIIARRLRETSTASAVIRSGLRIRWADFIVSKDYGAINRCRQHNHTGSLSEAPGIGVSDQGTAQVVGKRCSSAEFKSQMVAAQHGIGNCPGKPYV